MARLVGPFTKCHALRALHARQLRSKGSRGSGSLHITTPEPNLPTTLHSRQPASIHPLTGLIRGHAQDEALTMKLPDGEARVVRRTTDDAVAAPRDNDRGRSNPTSS